MNPCVTLAGASLLCFGFATIVSTLMVDTSPANPLGLLLLATALFVSAGLFGLLSLTWYLAQRAASLVTSAVIKGRYQLGAWLEGLEERYSLIRSVRLSKVIVPPDRRSPNERETELLTELQTRYIDGRLTEQEFEEELTLILE